SEPTIDSLRAAQSEFQNWIALCRQADPRGFCRDQRLKIEKRQQRCLDDLPLKDRSLHANQGLVREGNRSLRQRIDVAGEFHLPKVIEKASVKQRLSIGAGQRPEIIRILRAKAQALQKFDDIMQPTGDAEAAVEGIVSIAQTKDRLALPQPQLPVAISHGQLIQIGEQRQGMPVNLLKDGHESSPLVYYI